MLNAGRLVIGVVTWRPHVPAVVSGLLIVLLAAWFGILYRSLRARMTPRQAMILLAVRSADLEGREAFIGSATVPALAGLTCTVDDYQDAESLLRNLRRSRTGFDLYLPFLLLALLAALLEGWLINSGAMHAHVRKLADLFAAKISARRTDTGVADA